MRRDEIFGTHLRAERERAGITQTALAKLMGWSNAYLCDIENGRRDPPGEEHVAALARHLGAELWPLRVRAAVARGAVGVEGLDVEGVERVMLQVEALRPRVVTAPDGRRLEVRAGVFRGDSWIATWEEGRDRFMVPQENGVLKPWTRPPSDEKVLEVYAIAMLTRPAPAAPLPSSPSPPEATRRSVTRAESERMREERRARLLPGEELDFSEMKKPRRSRR